MLAGVIAFFTALPAIVELISRIGTLLGRLVAYSNQNDLNKWIAHLEDATDQLEKAKSDEEKFNAGKNFVSIIRGMGPK